MMRISHQVLPVLIIAGVMFCSAAPEIEPSELELLNHVAACRARCLDGYSSKILPDSACGANAGCFMCWENCKLFFGNFRIWGAMCGENGVSSSVCFVGCKIACNFYGQTRDALQSEARDNIGWNFQQRMILNLDFKHGELNVSWTPPVPDNSIGKKQSFVYGIFWMSDSVSEWTFLTETSRTNFSTRNGDIVSAVSDILIVAVTRDGVVANQSYRESLRLSADKNRDNIYLNEAVFDENGRFTFVGSTIFIIGVTISSFLCGMIIFFAGILVHHCTRRHRRRKKLARGYAVRHGMNLRQYLSRSFKLRRSGKETMESDEPRSRGYIATSPGLNDGASLIQINQVQSAPGTPYITRQNIFQQSRVTAIATRSHETVDRAETQAENLSDWAAEVVIEMLRASQIYTSTPHRSDAPLSFLDTPKSNSVGFLNDDYRSISPNLSGISEAKQSLFSTERAQRESTVYDSPTSNARVTEIENNQLLDLDDSVFV